MTSGIISLAATLATNAVFDSFIGDSKDVLAEALLCFGVSSISMDQDDVCKSTDEICISSIFPEGEDIHVSISHAADSIGLKEIPRYEVKIIEEDDWMKRAQESFHPVEVTEGLWVVPKWRTPPKAGQEKLEKACSQGGVPNKVKYGASELTEEEKPNWAFQQGTPRRKVKHAAALMSFSAVHTWTRE